MLLRSLVILRRSDRHFSISNHEGLRAAAAETQKKKDIKDLVVVTTTNSVTTMRMNDPKKLNGWTAEMLTRVMDLLVEVGNDSQTKVSSIDPRG